MFSTAAFANMIKHSYAQTEGKSPLLCWDIVRLDRAESSNRQHDLIMLNSLKNTQEWALNLNFRALVQNDFTIVITDMEQRIQWVSSSFRQMTGYSLQEAKGRNPSFLQGENTDLRRLSFLRTQLQAGNTAQAEIVNYRKNGEPYLCRLEVLPVRNHQGEPVNYLAIEKEVK